MAVTVRKSVCEARVNAAGVDCKKTHRDHTRKSRLTSARERRSTRNAGNNYERSKVTGDSCAIPIAVYFPRQGTIYAFLRTDDILPRNIIDRIEFCDWRFLLLVNVLFFQTHSTHRKTFLVRCACDTNSWLSMLNLVGFHRLSGCLHLAPTTIEYGRK